MEMEGKLLRQEEIAANTYLLEVEVADELARELKKTGSFVFLRRVEDPHYFHFPVGVVKVAENKIQVVIEVIGPKSSRLMEPPAKPILVRGPYYNGILGQPWIDNITCGTILLVAGGLGQAPALAIAAKLAANGNEVSALLAPGKIGKIFIDQELTDLGVRVVRVDSMRRNGMANLRQWLETEKHPDLIVSAGPDSQHYGVIDTMQAMDLNLPMAATNNATMCCGEGVCGSCERLTHDNHPIRLCKVQTDFAKLVT